MLKKAWADIRRGKNFYQIAEDVASAQLGDYYFIFDEQRVRRGRDQALIKAFDEDGIPLNRTYIDVDDERFIYFPISIGQLGLAVFHTYRRTGSTLDRERFLKFADWFIDNAQEDSKLGWRWLTDVPLPAYGNPGPWQSAFAQSRAISILLRAYQLTGQEHYQAAAEQALTSFRYPVSEGGVTSETRWGPFYEEYPADFPVCVLNGHIFALFGLYDYYRVFPQNTLAGTLFESGYSTVLNALDDFDLGFWTRYNYCQSDQYPSIDPATLTYQRLHVMQLTILNSLVQSTELYSYINRWSKQINIINYLYAQYVKYKVLNILNRL